MRMADVNDGMTQAMTIKATESHYCFSAHHALNTNAHYSKTIKKATL